MSMDLVGARCVVEARRGGNSLFARNVAASQGGMHASDDCVKGKRCGIAVDHGCFCWNADLHLVH